MSRSIQKSVEQIADGSSLQLDITGLEKFANYCVWAKAFNRKGEGNATTPACTSTDEDGMSDFCFFHMLVHSHQAEITFLKLKESLLGIYGLQSMKAITDIWGPQLSESRCPW